jgi:hypothetical protein
MKTKFFALILAASAGYLPSSYALQDLTGTYNCTGVDTKDGTFTAKDTMRLDKKNSTDKIAGYIFNAPGFQGGLSGFGTFDGKKLAIYFYSLDKSSEDAKNNYGVMIASVSKDRIKKVYYEPVYKGGSTGSVECVKISDKVSV